MSGGEFDEKPRRSWATSSDDSPLRCYLGMNGRITIRELIEHFADKYPHVDPMGLALNFCTVTWEEPPTPEDLAKREAYRLDQANRLENWERGMYEKLKAKYE